MPNEAKDGGAAFPHIESEKVLGLVYLAGGMSLRDWFAGQALSGMGWVSATPSAVEHKARAAFEIADAMLAERVKP